MDYASVKTCRFVLLAMSQKSMKSLREQALRIITNIASQGCLLKDQSRTPHVELMLVNICVGIAELCLESVIVNFDCVRPFRNT